MSELAVVFGGAGFIGSNLVHHLCATGFKVRVFDIMAPGSGAHPQNLAGLDIEIIHGDIRDATAVDDAVKGADIIYNLAGQTGHLDSMERPRNDLECNALGALNVLEAGRHHAPKARVIFASTRQVYGTPERLPVKESDPLRPPDINGVHKVAAESYHRVYESVYGMQTCVLRFSNVYGPRMRIADARQTFVGIWIRHMLEGQPFQVWGGTQRRDLVHVDDAVAAMIAAARSPEAVGQTFNVAGDEPVSLRHLAEQLAFGRTDAFTIVDMPADRAAIDVGDVLCDTTSIKSSLGWNPQISLDEGLAGTLAYFRKHHQTYVEDAL